VIQLPFRYVGLLDVQYEIVGWNLDRLVTRCRGREFILTRDNTLMLLRALGLNEKEIPGRHQERKFDGWDTAYQEQGSTHV
jgi:hypothetical protein